MLDHDARAFDRAPRFTLEPTPIAVLGGSEGDPDFDLTYARYVVLLSDGRAMTLSPVGNKLLLFRADGRGERELGRQGKGPGEITRPDGLQLFRGDTILIPDLANSRINWVHPDRGFVASKPLASTAVGRSALPAGRLPSGEIVVHSAGVVQRGVIDSVVRPPTSVFAVDPRTGTARRIAGVPDLELVMVEARYGGVARALTMVRRFGPSAGIVVWDSVIATGSGNGYQIDLRSATGTIMSRLRVPVPRRPVTEAMRRAQIARELERLEAQGAERLVDPAESKRLAREQPFADSLPSYRGFFATPDGLLWVVDAIAPGDTSWAATAFRHDGGIVGRLHVSGEGSPVTFSDDRVVVRTEDADGIVAFSIYRVKPPPQ